MQNDTLTVSRFDDYANGYRDVVNMTITSSGEEYEYFIGLRVGLMFGRLSMHGTEPGAWSFLDLGCGTGATEECVRGYIPTGTLHGVDESAASIDIAAARNIPGVSFKTVNPEGTIPLPDNSVNLIYMNGTIHHISESKRSAVIKDAYRVLEPGGNLFVFENNPNNPLTRRAMKLNPFDAGCRMVGVRDVEHLGRSNGLRVIESWYYFFFPAFLKALRRFDNKLRNIPFGGQFCVWFLKP